MLTYRTEGAMTALADFLAYELAQSSYRALEAKIGVSRGALENLINKTNTELPKLETLQRIADAYGKPMWEVVQMAGVELDLPKTPNERAQRMAQIVDQLPALESIINDLRRLSATAPDFVDGMLIGLEAMLRTHPLK